MKLSSNTVAVLKSFSAINPGIVIKGGNKLVTMSVLRNLVASAEIDEELPECAFYNLSEFLNVLSLFKEPELDFQDKFVLVSTGKSKVRYFYSDPTVIVAPTKDINAPDMEIKFSISQESLSELIKAAAVLQLPDVVVEGDGENITVAAKDLKNPSTNQFAQAVDSVEAGSEFKFQMVFKAESLQKLRTGSYVVEISQKRISRWSGVDNRTSYFVSLENTSKFEG